MKKKGFTLVELLVTVTIIGILSSVAIYGLTNTRQKAQDTSHLSGIRDVQLSLEAYKSVNGRYPEAGTQGTSLYIDGLVPSFMNKLPTSPNQSDTSGYIYTVSSDQKTYCLYVKNNIFRPESQASMYTVSCPKTWTVCKGPGTSSLVTCSGIVSS